jgi:hypothetical protein
MSKCDCVRVETVKRVMNLPDACNFFLFAGDLSHPKALLLLSLFSLFCYFHVVLMVCAVTNIVLHVH